VEIIRFKYFLRTVPPPGERESIRAEANTANSSSHGRTALLDSGCGPSSVFPLGSGMIDKDSIMPSTGRIKLADGSLIPIAVEGTSARLPGKIIEAAGIDQGLISFGALEAGGLRYVVKEDTNERHFVDGNGKTVIVATFDPITKLYHVNLNSLRNEEVRYAANRASRLWTSVAAPPIQEMITLLHKGLGHVSMEKLIVALRLKLIKNLPTEVTEKAIRKYWPHCNECITGGAIRIPASRKSTEETEACAATEEAEAEDDNENEEGEENDSDLLDLARLSGKHKKQLLQINTQASPAIFMDIMDPILPKVSIITEDDSSELDEDARRREDEDDWKEVQALAEKSGGRFTVTREAREGTTRPVIHFKDVRKVGDIVSFDIKQVAGGKFDASRAGTTHILFARDQFSNFISWAPMAGRERLAQAMEKIIIEYEKEGHKLGTAKVDNEFVGRGLDELRIDHDGIKFLYGSPGDSYQNGFAEVGIKTAFTKGRINLQGAPLSYPASEWEPAVNHAVLGINATTLSSSGKCSSYEEFFREEFDFDRIPCLPFGTEVQSLEDKEQLDALDPKTSPGHFLFGSTEHHQVAKIRDTATGKIRMRRSYFPTGSLTTNGSREFSEEISTEEQRGEKPQQAADPRLTRKDRLRLNQIKAAEEKKMLKVAKDAIRAEAKRKVKEAKEAKDAARAAEDAARQGRKEAAQGRRARIRQDKKDKDRAAGIPQYEDKVAASQAANNAKQQEPTPAYVTKQPAKYEDFRRYRPKKGMIR